MPAGQSKSVEGKPLYVTMFHSFGLDIGSISIRANESQKNLLWHLLQILLVHRNHPLLQEELICYLWGDSPPQQPQPALKNLVYRLRRELKSQGVSNAKDLIIWDGTRYRWNNHFACIIDAEKMQDHYFQGALEPVGSEEQQEHYLKVVSYYKGPFLPSRKHEPWTEPLRREYHKMFLTAANALVENYWQEKNFLAVESIAKQVLAIDPFAEEMHKTVLQGLLSRGQTDCAIAHYRYTAHRYQQQGLHLPQFMVSFYHRLLALVEEERLIGDYQKNTTESAFFCEYDTFRRLYLSEARAALLLKKDVYLMAVNVDYQGDYTKEISMVAAAMDTLHTVFLHLLRPEDIFTKASDNHYLVLLILGEDKERRKGIVEKLIPRFRYFHRTPEVNLRVNLQRLEPDRTEGSHFV